MSHFYQWLYNTYGALQEKIQIELDNVNKFVSIKKRRKNETESLKDSKT